MGVMPTTKRFAVRGNGPFPFDMLRYDSCWPAQQADVSRLMDTGDRIVTLESRCRPTVERWVSFGWACLENRP